MISIVFGAIGSGKSTFLTYCAYRALNHKSVTVDKRQITVKSYDRIYSNFCIDGCYKLDFDNLGVQDFHDCLILVDEITCFADSRDFKSFNSNLKFFFSQHRKKNIDIIIASQSYDDSDRRIRNLADSYYLITPWLFGFIKIQRISVSITVKDGTISNFYSLSSPIHSKFIKCSKYWSFFDTKALITHDFLPPVQAEKWNTVPDSLKNVK